MLISASRRTDIPAFFGEWFMGRIRDGYFDRINPFNSHQVKRISLLPDDVDAIVFWTKNPKPFLKHLDELDSRGYRYYFQFTLNDYPPEFEPNLPNISARIDTFKKLSERIGPEKVIWRYDPIIVSSVTPVRYHIETITAMTAELSGYSSRMMISFLDFYGKIQGRLKELETKHQISFTDIAAPEHAGQLEQLLEPLVQVAHMNGFEVLSCAEKLDLEPYDIGHGACIDGQLLNELFLLEKGYGKDKHQRPECLCTEAADMGVYNTCKFICTYCYAVGSEKRVRETLDKHDPSGASLITK
ncbi:DUF1848 domain-containing protein [Paenibacillus sp. NFR01]|uniref:DUF1848 domain-containing protein n=1 Tax=Paenibacillus sp. NFR01 TaxID=1566279 RepID=UPI0008C29FCD|nr:DUF1848 domain-containing protein [Paenibacillus sp. NFR01]SES94765.1 protein of unknown function [Paenibacillus sp. NFR01]